LRSVLAFPPPASPTYLPLGLASLAPLFAARGLPVRLLDLNLDVWTRLARSEPGGPGLLDFLQGRSGDFFDEPSYRSQGVVWSRLRARWSGVEEEALRRLREGTAGEGLPEVLEAQAEELLAGDPELVGLSAFSLGQVGPALALAARLRRRAGGSRGPRIILGGAAAAHLHAEDLLAACPWIDGVLAGEGEPGVEAILAGADDRDVPGLVHRSGGAIVRNRPPATLSLSRLPAPDFSGLPVAAAFDPFPVVPVLLSRGCRWRKCGFCAHNRGFAGYRRKDIGRFVDELEAYGKSPGARHFYLADQYVEAADLELLSSAILERGLAIDWSVMGRPTADYTPERLDLFSRAGCRWISWGIETASPRLLGVIRKGTDAAVLKSVLAASAGAGISNLAMMIFGLPTGTDDDLRETFAFLEEAGESIDAVTSSIFTLWEGTPFGRDPARHGLSVVGPAALLRVGDRQVRSFRLDYREVASDGTLRPPRGAQEADAWQERRRWLSGYPFLESLPCEHYLAYASRRARDGREPRRPVPRAA